MNTTGVSSNFLGHPKGLFYLFFAELWERFSFYGMRALLVLYMTKQLLFEDTISFDIFAAYMSLVYFTPIIGGVLADNYLGYRKSIILGGIMMALGHFFLSIETPFFFFGSLALIIVGNGFFKPNISTFVGTLYESGDARRDSGFTIFYMGINIGGAVAPLLCAWLAEVYGWHFGFILAGIGMLLGLFFFHRGMKEGVFGDKGLVPNPVIYAKKIFGMNKGVLITLLGFLSVPLFALIVKYNEYEHYIVWVASFVIVGALSYIYRSVEKPYKSRLLVAAYFTILMSLFWAIFEQAGSSLTLFADRNIILVGMNAAQTNSINSGFIILLAVPFSLLWGYLKRVGKNPNSAIKSGIGLVLLGVGFIVFASSANAADGLAQTPMWYLVVGYFILTVGELFISPIGLSKMTELSPVKYLAFIMGVFFTSSFYGHFFAGKIAKLTTVNEGEVNPFSEGVLGQVTEFITGLAPQVSTSSESGLAQLYSYVSVYTGFGVLTLIIGLLAIMVSPVIKKMMDGVQ
ncbi:MAG: POT family proton-dependent oligopeptide transporter [Saprospiraceae bacterium]|jgi:POT family proton-dependent oligopeptide transporter